MTSCAHAGGRTQSRRGGCHPPCRYQNPAVKRARVTRALPTSTASRHVCSAAPCERWAPIPCQPHVQRVCCHSRHLAAASVQHSRLRVPRPLGVFVCFRETGARSWPRGLASKGHVACARAAPCPRSRGHGVAGSCTAGRRRWPGRTTGRAAGRCLRHPRGDWGLTSKRRHGVRPGLAQRHTCCEPAIHGSAWRKNTTTNSGTTFGWESERIPICVGWSYVWTATVTSSMIRMPAPAAASGHNVRWRGCDSAYRHRCIHQRHELPVRHHALLLTFTAWIHELAFRVLLSGRLLRDMHGTNTRWTRDASPLYYLYNYLYNT